MDVDDLEKRGFSPEDVNILVSSFSHGWAIAKLILLDSHRGLDLSYARNFPPGLEGRVKWMRCLPVCSGVERR